MCLGTYKMTDTLLYFFFVFAHKHSCTIKCDKMSVLIYKIHLFDYSAPFNSKYHSGVQHGAAAYDDSLNNDKKNRILSSYLHLHQKNVVRTGQYNFLSQ